MSGVTLRKVKTDEAEMRLDRWFKRNCPEFTFGQVQKMLRGGQIRVDGKRAKAGQNLEPGQEIRVPPAPVMSGGGLGPWQKGGQYDQAAGGEYAKSGPARSNASEEDLQALKDSVIFYDEVVLAINKPAGLAVQGGTNTALHVDGMLDALKLDSKERPKLVHRLDKDTSGVLLLARSASAANALTKAFKDKSTRKLYWAIVSGAPDQREGLIDAPLAKHGSKGSEKMVIDEKEGKSAQTVYRQLARAGRRAAWLALSPLTGRTHQLRAHCQAMGCPILGDGKYGGAQAFRDGLSNQMHLHARAIDFPHPVTGHRVIIEAPVPEHFRETFKALNFDPKTATKFVTPEIHREKEVKPKPKEKPSRLRRK
ncbi:RluA family pseudouridine synthase [Thalassospira alkalitolerans]|mgnify:CR=1 FL=1|uniref:Pseudouridine synthase n=1 Tax=Thalassospira alkalitolerans TaxID=1293890 RepID=A0A1Y2LC08_9PROT|nr:RluA family pseudouridine synthase [Thalassospira alkalitolerans]OSQ48094.1 pseudouridine synthase [Thalassospira alkalitolerans]|tara:strand:- start:69801 stop:70901 length:1101 start_codon:yes stop_codon:yes gene_type:complete